MHTGNASTADAVLAEPGFVTSSRLATVSASAGTIEAAAAALSESHVGGAVVLTSETIDGIGNAWNVFSELCPDANRHEELLPRGQPLVEFLLIEEFDQTHEGPAIELLDLCAKGQFAVREELRVFQILDNERRTRIRSRLH